MYFFFLKFIFPGQRVLLTAVHPCATPVVTCANSRVRINTDAALEFARGIPALLDTHRIQLMMGKVQSGSRLTVLSPEAAC